MPPKKKDDAHGIAHTTVTSTPPPRAEPPVVAPEPSAPPLPADAGVLVHKDRSGPVRELQPTEGQSNAGTMARMAREAVGLDPDTGLPKEKN